MTRTNSLSQTHACQFGLSKLLSTITHIDVAATTLFDGPC
jgi:hypothetical protein